MVRVDWALPEQQSPVTGAVTKNSIKPRPCTHLARKKWILAQQWRHLEVGARKASTGLHMRVVQKLTWKERPVLSNSTSTNWKYWSMDHKDSTAPSAYSTKNLRAAGVRISYANSNLWPEVWLRNAQHNAHIDWHNYA